MGAPECQSIANRVLCFCSQAAQKKKTNHFQYLGSSVTELSMLPVSFAVISGHAFPIGQGQSEYLQQLLATRQELDVLLCQLEVFGNIKSTASTQSK